MPKAQKGVLIKVDVATKIYLTQNVKEYSQFKFLEIDEHHLFIREGWLDFVQEKVQEHKDKYYEKDDKK